MAKFADYMEKIESGGVEGCKKLENSDKEGFTGITDQMSVVMLDEEGMRK